METIDVSDIVSDFGEPQPVTRKRAAATTYTDGIASVPSTTSTTIHVVLQPVSGRDLQIDPTGLWARASYKAYTSDDVRTVQESGATLPDVLSVNGRNYQAHSVADWVQHGVYRKLALVEDTPQ